MDTNSTYIPTQEDLDYQRAQVVQTWKDRIFRFFYNIWPSVNRVIAYFFYHIMRVLKGFFKIALQSITNKN